MQIYTYNKKLQQSLQRTEIQELLNYFLELQEPVILREIRKNFPNQKHLDKNLDFLIDNDIVSRQDRRYQLSLTIVTEYPTTELVEKFIQTANNKYTTEELLVWLGEELRLAELSDTIAIDFMLPISNRLENAHFQLVTINRGEKLAETLPNYFENIDQPKLFPNLAALIGDVNPEFFSNQLSLILDQVIIGKKPKRESIFLDSLLTTQVITSRPEWQLNIPIYTKTISPDFVQKMDKRTRFFFIQQLTERLLGERESFTYLIKKKA